MANETMSKTLADTEPSAERTRSGYYYRPNVDILEKTDELVVVADVPGTTPQGIDIDFDNGELTIHARVPPRNEDVEFLLHEYGVGDYFRTFRVSEAIDASRITAEYADGVLTLHLPKAEAAKPRKIPVRA